MMTTTMIPTWINKRWLITLPEHRAVRPEWKTGWEVERLASMFRNIKKGDVVFDVGAEEGDLSGLFAMWAGKTGGMVLFEPNSKVWPNIKAIWQANRLRTPLGCFMGFASNVTKELQDKALFESSWPSCADGPIIGDHGFLNLVERPDVAQIRLDDFSAKTNILPSMITMDVEGAELQVLKGAERILSEVKPLVYISVHPESMLHDFNQYKTELDSFLHFCGYDIVHLAYDHELHIVAFHKKGREFLGLKKDFPHG